MRPEQRINQIRTDFEKMQSREDFLRLLNKAKPLVYGKKAVPFKLKQLTWHANPKLGGKRYVEFKIKKKSGEERCIHAPVRGLKSLQKTLSFVLHCVYEPHHAAMGFVRKKSIVDNAKLHVGSWYVYNIDLKDFFPSVDQARVWKCLQLKPFNLNKESSAAPKLQLGARSFKINPNGWVTPDTNRLDIANTIASLCCTEMMVERKNDAGEWEIVKRKALPQGAPTSPIITNIVCQRLDYILSGVAKRFGLKYSRYADDITFSSMHNVYQPEGEFLKELRRVVAEQGFHIKESKTRLQKEGYRKEVTGLLVNEKVNVPQRYIKQLRMWLYYWERYGLEKASSFFVQQYRVDKGHIKKGKPNMANVIAGKLDYLKMVKGSENELYLKLRGRFDRLEGTANPINVALDLWEKEEIEKAMDIYYYENNNRSVQMEKNKFDFITEILAQKRLTTIQKERIVKLSAQEIRLEKNKDQAQLKQIEQLKKELNQFKNAQASSTTSKSDKKNSSKNKKEPNPKHVADFMSLFNQRNGLKYLTHDFDEDSQFNVKIFLSKAKKSFNLSTKEFSIPESLWAIVNQFSFAPKPDWRSLSEEYENKEMNCGWSSLSWENWFKENKLHPIRNEKFKEVINDFRRITRIESPNLERLIDKCIQNVIGENHGFEINKKELSKADFYTHVGFLKVAIETIFEEIKKYSNVNNENVNNKKKISIEYKRETAGEYFVRKLIITHHNSFPKKELDVLLKEWQEKGNMGKIKEKLKGYCHWEVETNIEDKPKRVTILMDKETPESEDIRAADVDVDVNVAGFTHVLTFYYK